MTRAVATGLMAFFFWLGVCLHPVHAVESVPPIFDAHIHYSEDVWNSLPPQRALQQLTGAGIQRALVSSTPTAGTERLYAAAPERVVPFLRPYRGPAHRYTWFKDPDVPAYVRDGVERFPYQGIGEFHVFGADAGTPIVRQVLELARERGLALHAHTDLEGLEIILQGAPDVPVIWAHGGFDVPVATLRGLLDQHAKLYLELSFREGITAEGRLTPEWRTLLTEHRGRFLVGMDTYLPSRWAELSELVAEAQQWLGQLPAGVAGDIAYHNAARLFPPRGENQK